ncbi:MAG: endonuclease/exonuclease/phosphatase family protein [Muribaculaceae bacterium]
MKKKTNKISVLGFAHGLLGRIVLLLSVLVGLALLASAWGGLIDPRITAKPALLTLGLPYVAMVAVAMVAVALLCRAKKAAVLLLIAIVASLPKVLVVSPVHIYNPKVQPEQEPLLLKVMSFNVMYFIYNESEYWNNCNAAAEYIINSGADVVAVQEGDVGTYLSQMPSMQQSYAKLKSAYPYRSGLKGPSMSLLSRYPFTVEKVDTLTGGSSCAVYYKLNIKGREVYLANAHLQSISLNSDDKDFFIQYTNPQNMRNKLADSQKLKSSIVRKLQNAFVRRADQADLVRMQLNELGENVILCGDFNDTPCSFAYNTIKGKDMHDAFEECGLGPIITYHENRFWLKIDHILYRGAMKAVDFERHKVKVSDHYPLTATLLLQPLADD